MTAKKKGRATRAAATPRRGDPPPPLAPLPPCEIPGVECGADTRPGSVSWAWPDRLPAAQITLLEGKKGAGKSSVAAAVAAAFTGGPQPPGWGLAGIRPVLWCGSEESWANVILPRLILAGATPSMLYRAALKDDSGKPRRLSLPAGLPDLRALLQGTRAGLLVLDPFSSLADAGLNLCYEQPARSYLEPLADLLTDTNCTALLLRHLRKGGHGDALDQGLGSVAVGNTARAILRCDVHPTDDALNVLSVVACNAGKRPPALLYRLAPEGGTVRVVWQGESTLNADALAEGRSGVADRDECRDALKLLRELLATADVQAGTVQREAEAAGITPKQLRRAKAELRITSDRRSAGNDGSGAWFWQRPKGGFPPVEVAGP